MPPQDHGEGRPSRGRLEGPGRDAGGLGGAHGAIIWRGETSARIVSDLLSTHLLSFPVAAAAAAAPLSQELFTGKKQSALYVLDTTDGSVTSVAGLPDGTMPGQPVWTPCGQGVVFVAWLNIAPHFETDRRLGSAHCFNRRAQSPAAARASVMSAASTSALR